MNWKMKSADTTDKHVPPTNEAKTEIIRPPEVKCEKKKNPAMQEEWNSYLGPKSQQLLGIL